MLARAAYILGEEPETSQTYINFRLDFSPNTGHQNPDINALFAPGTYTFAQPLQNAIEQHADLEDDAPEHHGRGKSHGENIHMLPPAIRNFIYLQHEISDQDVGTMPTITLPDDIPPMAGIGSKKIEKKREKKRYELHLYLLMIQMYNQLFAETLISIQNAKRELLQIVDEIKEIEHDPRLEKVAFNAESDGITDKMETYIQDDLDRYKNQLKMRPPPNSKSLKEMMDDISKTLHFFQKKRDDIMESAERIQNATPPRNETHTPSRLHSMATAIPAHHALSGASGSRSRSSSSSGGNNGNSGDADSTNNDPLPDIE